MSRSSSAARRFGGLVMTIASDDEVDDLDALSEEEQFLDDKDTASANKSASKGGKKKPAKKPTKKDVEEDEREAEAAMSFFAEIDSSAAAAEADKLRRSQEQRVYSAKNENLRSAIQKQIDVVSQRKAAAMAALAKEVAKNEEEAEAGDNDDSDDGDDDADSGNDDDDGEPDSEDSDAMIDAELEDDDEEDAKPKTKAGKAALASKPTKTAAAAAVKSSKTAKSAAAVAVDPNALKIIDAASEGPEWGKDADGEDEDGDGSSDSELDSALNREVFEDQQTFDANENADFADLKLSRATLQGIRAMGFLKPTPIQRAAIPVALSGVDILANAVTGSGKTVAFVIPILERLLHAPRRAALTRAVIITPTRELAEQIHKVAQGLGRSTGARSTCVVGGLSLSAQEMELRARPDIVVATPGRLIDHLANSKSVHLDDVEMLVLDEADRLLEMGFVDAVKQIVACCPRGRQTMLFSATLGENVLDLINMTLHNPQRITVDKTSSIVDTLTQEFVRLRKDSDLVREAIVIALCKRKFTSRTIIFCRTKIDAHRLMILFGLSGLKAAEMHGDLTQVQRQEALEDFRNHKVDFLICTDLASRGIDIKGVQVVINLHMPKELPQYVHRVGRTARAGSRGLAVSLMGENDRRLLRDIMKHARNVVRKREVPPAVIVQYSQHVAALEGDVENVLKEEKFEREIARSEMDLRRATNVVEHKDEIYSRPAREWFQSNAEKRAVRERSGLVSGDRVTDTNKAREKALKDAAKELEADSSSSEDIDSTIGVHGKKKKFADLSRTERRKKTLGAEREREVKSTADRLRAEAATMPEKERKKLLHTVMVMTKPEIAVRRAKKAEHREKMKVIMGHENDGAGPEALERRMKQMRRDNVNVVREAKRTAKEMKQAGEDVDVKEYIDKALGSKKAKMAPQERDRKYLDRNSAEMLGRSDLSGEKKRYADATKLHARNAKAADAQFLESIKPRKTNKSLSRHRRR